MKSREGTTLDARETGNVMREGTDGHLLLIWIRNIFCLCVIQSLYDLRLLLSAYQSIRSIERYLELEHKTYLIPDHPVLNQ
jgi:hypothetical protein